MSMIEIQTFQKIVDVAEDLGTLQERLRRKDKHSEHIITMIILL